MYVASICSLFAAFQSFMTHERILVKLCCHSHRYELRAGQLLQKGKVWA